MPMRDFVEIGCPNCEDVVHVGPIYLDVDIY
jgi:hypothetical protein